MHALLITTKVKQRTGSQLDLMAGEMNSDGELGCLTKSLYARSHFFHISGEFGYRAHSLAKVAQI